MSVKQQRGCNKPKRGVTGMVKIGRDGDGLGYSRKNPLHPLNGVIFNPPSLSPGFPEAQDPPPVWISGKKILGLNLIYFF